MRPETNSRRLFGITRSKGKMFEFGLPLEAHIAVPEGRNPEELILLSVGTLGDAAAHVCGSDDLEHHFDGSLAEELRFSASYFDALLASRFSPNLDPDISLLASATYYLAGRPGSSWYFLDKLQILHSTHRCKFLLGGYLRLIGTLRYLPCKILMLLSPKISQC
jgi:POLQ-like helicase